MFHSGECRMYPFLSRSRLVCSRPLWVQHNSTRVALVDSDPDWTHSTPKPAQVLCFLSQQLAQRPIHLPHRNWCPSSALPCLIIWSVPRFGPLSFYSPVLTAAIAWLLAPPFPPRKLWNSLLLAILLFPVLTPLNPFLHHGTSIICEIQIGLCWKPLIRFPLFSVKIKSQNPWHSL